ncbi:MAG TPA: hypothetical protein DCL81_04180, partial [Algoriphagus sp.]|nr:hypothetical protein [Algoriphagus sp.]
MTISINCQSQDLPKSSIQYQPKYVPLPQGAFVSVGVISWEGKLPSEKLFLSLEIHASTAIDSIKIISKIAENQTETLLKAGEILGQQTLEVQSNKLSEISRANVYIKLKATHDIRDRVSI